MKKVNKLLFCLVLGFIMMGSVASAQQDAKGCKDHPLFTRMPNTYIDSCKYSEFAAEDWYDPDTQGKTSVKVEGRHYYNRYYTQKGFEGKRSNLQVTRNYENAFKKIGGSVYERSDDVAYMKVLKDGKEIWAKVYVQGGDTINITIIEREAMKQEVVADAKFMAVGTSSSGAPAQQDAKGCKDHPLFTRMPNTYIDSCKYSEFAAEDWYDPDTQGKTSMKVEGRHYYNRYYTQKGFEGKRSNLQVTRNYENAFKKIGGSVYERSDDVAYMKVLKDGKEIWAKVYVQGGDTINITIIEKEAMKQEVTADAKFMAEGISSTGHVAIYGIYFDFNKSDIKPESESALNEIAKLLTGNPSLKVFIVGHTDNVGGVDYNMKLSQARADAVVKALTTKYKINPQSLKAYGVGQLTPVAPNKTEEGRTKNRRVELVEQ